MPPDPKRPTSAALLAAWCKAGVQSFGGGPATLALIRREFVVRNGWIDEAEFSREWSLCQFAPGINLVAFAILLGKRLGGWPAIAIGLAGLLFPSFAITALLTAVYASYKNTHQAQAAMHGIVPAVAAVGFATSFQMAIPLLKQSAQEGRVSLAGAIVLLLGVVLLIVFLHPPVVAVLIAAGTLGAFYRWFRSRSANSA